MQNPIINKTVEMLREMLAKLEDRFDADFLCIYGPLAPDLVNLFRDAVETFKASDNPRDRLCIMLTTDGGDANTTERLVKISRHHYKEVYFIVPDYAYSAGTILCMSGDRIYMNYASVLGPIDPQVPNKENRFVPALGYLEKINDMLNRAATGDISEAEFFILKEFDLAELSLYEQAKELTTDLLKEWLVEYKFKNWTKHKTSGKNVTEDEKKERAEKIANDLANYARWKSHGRPLDMKTLTELKLKIDDFGTDKELEKMIVDFHYMMVDYMRNIGTEAMIFHRREFL